MLEEIVVRERELASLTERLLAATPDSIHARVEETRRFVEEGISNLKELLNENAPLAKAELHRHLNSVVMIPSNHGKEWHYIAEGDWDLLGGDSSLASKRQRLNWRLEMVAGVGFEPTTSGL